MNLRWQRCKRPPPGRVVCAAPWWAQTTLERCARAELAPNTVMRSL